MRAVIQRVNKAAVEINGTTHAQINKGILVLIAFAKEDTDNTIEKFVQKIINLRIFSDEQGLMNLSIKDIEGEVLAVSQFTLYADTKKGNRPSFFDSAKPDIAKPLYEKFLYALQKNYPNKIKSGIFGADMKVHLINNGPVTIILEA